MAMRAHVPQPARDEVPRKSMSVSTPVGSIAVSASGSAIVGAEWTCGEYENVVHGPCETAGTSAAAESDRVLEEAVSQLQSYFDGNLAAFDLAIDLQGISDVARRVLTTLADTVEHGTTITYGELAERSRTDVPARAVGGIMGLNPIPIIVPCHRVVASDGLGGYSGGLPGTGLETKRWLLEFEEALPQPLF